MVTNKSDYQSDHQSLVAQTERAQITIGHLESDLKITREALAAIAHALKEPNGGDYFQARGILDRLDIYHDDLHGERVLLRVAESALDRTRSA